MMVRITDITVSMRVPIFIEDALASLVVKDDSGIFFPEPRISNPNSRVSSPELWGARWHG